MKFLIFLISATLSLTAFAQPKEKIVSLDQAIELAKKNSEDLELKVQAIRNNESIYREVLGTALPQVSMDITWQKYLTDVYFFGSSYDLSYQLSSGITISQTLWAFGRVGAAIDAAKAGFRVGELEKTLTEKQVEYMAHAAYYSVLFSQEQLQIAEKSLASAKQNLNILQQKFSGGRPPQSDLVRLQSDVAARIPLVKSAESNYRQALWAFAQVIGEKEVDHLKLSTAFQTSFKSLEYKELKAKLDNNLPQIQILNEVVKYADESAKIYEAADLPTITALANYSYSGTGATGTLDPDDLNTSAYAGINISWNLWDGGSTKAKAQQARINKKITEIKKKKQIEILDLQLVQKWENYKSLVESNESAKKAVQLAERSFLISQRKFRTGQTSLTEMNSTDMALTQSRIALVSNVFQIHTSLAEISNLLSLKPGELQ